MLYPDQKGFLFLYPYWVRFTFKCELSGLTQVLATESPIKMMKYTFYYTLKAFFSQNI